MTEPEKGAAGQWPMAQFGDVLRRVERTVTIDDAKEYATVGVRWYGKGAFVRERLLGADIAAKQQSIVKKRDVVYKQALRVEGVLRRRG